MKGLYYIYLPQNGGFELQLAQDPTDAEVLEAMNGANPYRTQEIKSFRIVDFNDEDVNLPVLYPN
jgi:hypothetical protein